MTTADPFLTFACAGRRVELPAGGRFVQERPLQYRDAPQADVKAVVERVRGGTPWRQAVADAFGQSQPWLHRIITAPERLHLLERFHPAPGVTVVDVGAGWGQFALPLARNCRVCAVEPTPERLEFIATAAAQEGATERMAFVQADYLSVDFDRPFDWACCIGVLEWVGKFVPEADPFGTQMEFLRKLRRELRPGGTLLLGIENRLGLKYLLGARDDHTGVAGISVFERSLAAKKWKAQTGEELRVFTFTRAELDAMLQEAGFKKREFFAALPDYKVPEAILPLGPEVDRHLLDAPPIPEHDGCDGTPLPDPEALASHYRSLAKLRIASDFVPSFVVTAS